MRKILLLKLAVAALAVAGVLTVSTPVTGQSADHPRATILLKSGERITGEVIDVAPDAVLLWRNQTSTRRIPMSDIVLLDFSGTARNLPETEYVADRRNDHVLVLEDGTSVSGRFVDTAAWVTFRTRDGRELQYRASDVARLYVAEPPWLEATSGRFDPYGRYDRYNLRREVRVPAAEQWTATGIQVREGEMISFSARGEIVLSRTPNDFARPAGSHILQRTAPNAPLRDELAGALIGRVDNSAPFGIGDQTMPLPMPATGQLYLGINDDGFVDNHGAFEVVVTRRANSN